MTITQIIIIVTLLAFVIVGLLVKKSNMSSYSGFTMNRGRLNWFTIAAGISMTFAGGASILTTSSIGYSFKWYSLVDPIALVLGILIVLIFYNNYEKDKGTTISDLLSSNHKGLTVLIGIVTSLTFILIVAANFVSLSKLLSPYFPTVNPLLLTFIFSTLVFSYVFFGGFNSVTRTDILQYVLITALLIIPVLFFVINHRDNLTANVVTHNFEVMPVDYIILLSIPMLFTPLSQDINIRIKSAKNAIHGKFGLIFGALFYCSIVVCTAYVGIYMGNHNVALSDPEQAVPSFFKSNFPKFGILAIIAALAAIVSSLDSYILNSMTSISNDIIKSVAKSRIGVSKTIRIAALITYIIAMAIALFFNVILALTLTSLLLYISILMPIVVGKKLKISGNGLFVGSIINITTIVIVEVLSLQISPKALLYPLFGCIVMVLVSLIKSQKYERG